MARWNFEIFVFRFVFGGVLKVKMVAIEKLKPYWRNPRKRSASSIKKIAASIEAYGWRQPIVVDREFVVIIGHGRLEAATLLKTKRVPVHVADNLTDAQAKALRLADNKVSEESDWDMEQLLAELGDLKGINFDTAMAGFDADDLKKLATDMDDAGIAKEQTEAAAPFVGDLEGEQEEEREEQTPGDQKSEKTTGDDSQDSLVTFSDTMTLRQREVVNAAIKKAKGKEKLERRGDALFHICELYLEEQLE